MKRLHKTANLKYHLINDLSDEAGERLSSRTCKLERVERLLDNSTVGILLVVVLLSLSTMANLGEAFSSSHSRVLGRVKRLIGTSCLAVFATDVPLLLATCWDLSSSLLDLSLFEFWWPSAITSLYRLIFLPSLTSLLRFWMLSWNPFASPDVLNRLALGEVPFKCANSLSKSSLELYGNSRPKISMLSLTSCGVHISTCTSESTIEVLIVGDGMSFCLSEELCSSQLHVPARGERLIGTSCIPVFATDVMPLFAVFSALCFDKADVPFSSSLSLSPLIANTAVFFASRPEILMCSLRICNSRLDSSIELRSSIDVLPFAEVPSVSGFLNVSNLLAWSLSLSVSLKGSAKFFRSVSSFTSVEIKAVLVADELEVGGFINLSALSCTFVALVIIIIDLDCASLAG
uniref:Uncharacterized protein n=1 Tax=Glossina pallidipes TaxID=7398 RepID=A0A1B0A1N8_GLOPL